MAAKILLVDDDNILRESLGDWLRGLEYQVEDCSLTKDALDRIKADNYDLIISDFSMPGMNGVEFGLEAVKIKPIPFLLLTGNQGTMFTKYVYGSGLKCRIASKDLMLDELAKAVDEAMYG